MRPLPVVRLQLPNDCSHRHQQLFRCTPAVGLREGYDWRRGKLSINPLFKVVEHICSGLVSGPVDIAAGPLCLQRREKPSHGCVVPAVSRPAHVAGHTVLVQQLLELITADLTAHIRVLQQLCIWPSSPYRHQHRIADQLSRHGLRHRPAHDQA